MLEKLRNMEPLPKEEENRITRRLQLSVIVFAVAILAFIIWAIVKKKEPNGLYMGIVVLFLLCNWFFSDVAPIFFARALAGRSRRQVSAYMKAAGFGLLANFGLGWFIYAMNNQSLIGALVYLAGITFSRKQMDIYNSDETEEEEEPQEEVVVPESLPTASDRLRRLNEISAQQDAALREAEGQDAQLQDETQEDGEEDGSV